MLLLTDLWVSAAQIYQYLLMARRVGCLFFTSQTVHQRVSWFMYLCALPVKFLWNRFPEMVLLRQRLCALKMLIVTARLPLEGVVQFILSLQLCKRGPFPLRLLHMGIFKNCPGKNLFLLHFLTGDSFHYVSSLVEKEKSNCGFSKPL